LVKKMAAAHMARDTDALSKLRDPDALSFPDDVKRAKTDMRIHGVLICSLFGNDQLAFARTVTVFEKRRSLGHQSWLLVVRRNGDRWKLLAITSDRAPSRRISFQRSATAKALSGGPNTTRPEAPRLVYPENNARPEPANGQKYGVFRWQHSEDANTAMEMLETACRYKGRAAFQTLAMQLKPPSHEKYTAGEHPASWTRSKRRQCRWRVWRVARSGRIGFSETRHIPVLR
jgi:hypothetical protein